MRDDKANHNCLVGCLMHSSDEPSQSDNQDPEIMSYFLVRKTINSQEYESASASPLRPHSRERSNDDSPKVPNSQKSGESKRSKLRKRGSFGSSQSASSKYRKVTDWNVRTSDTIPSLFEPSARHPVDPPRLPKRGFEWVWFPEGYWAERQIRELIQSKDLMKDRWWTRSSSQKSKSPTKTASGDTNTIDDKGPAPLIVPEIKIGSISYKSTNKTSRRASENESQKSKNLWGFNFIKPLPPGDNYLDIQRKGLYYRTKRNIETRFRHKPKIVRAFSI
jgi:parafibromin